MKDCAWEEESRGRVWRYVVSGMKCCRTACKRVILLFCLFTTVIAAFECPCKIHLPPEYRPVEAPPS